MEFFPHPVMALILRSSMLTWAMAAVEESWHRANFGAERKVFQVYEWLECGMHNTKTKTL